MGQSRKSLTDTTYSANPIDTLRYTYNIRGWVKGINKDYANAANSAVNWFGMELGYDYGFVAPQINGNIAGIKWRNAEDGQQRAYGFAYDNLNRLSKADFTQNAGINTWNTSAGIDFSVHSISYDLNGNILTLNQMGIKVNTSTLVDSLAYGYNTNSNRLNYVTDRVNDTTAHLGDFTEITSNTNQDYNWDGNGNLTLDNNKNITLIHYNYLNLPDSIRIKGKGYIKYVYDAAGIKLQKITTDSTASPVKITRTDYAGAFIYQNDTLQYIGTEEGRSRPKRANYSDTMLYDYFEKDHLGNTRVVLTDEKQYDVYPAATLEKNTNSFLLQQSFYAINPADTIGVASIASWPTTANRNYPDSNTGVYNNDPYDTSANISKVVYRLNGATGDKTGLGITLKVMAGDAVNILGKSFWHNSGTVNNGYPISVALTNLISAFTGTQGVAAAGKGSSAVLTTDINSSTADVSSLKYLLDTAKGSTGSVPRAYINWILFDEQFNPVKSGSSFDAVSSTADNVKPHNISVNIPTGGYLYVYCSNESNFDVFFDNLQLVDTRGPLLETDNYYPFGLLMSGISSQAAGKLENLRKFNKGSELQHKEFSDGSGLELYATNFRSLDPQIGRWWQIDPKPNMGESPYASMGNNPILKNDPLGDTLWDAKGKPITYTVNKDGTLKWSKNVTGDWKRIGNDLAKNKTGLGVLNKLASAKWGVTMKVTPDNNPKDYGKTTPHTEWAANKKDVVVKSVDIVIYEGAVKEMQGQTQSGAQHVGDRGKAYDMLFALGDEESAVAAVATHEGTHGSDYNNINQSERNSTFGEKNDVESAPRSNELQYMQQAIATDLMKLSLQIINIFR